MRSAASPALAELGDQQRLGAAYLVEADAEEDGHERERRGGRCGKAEETGLRIVAQQLVGGKAEGRKEGSENRPRQRIALLDPRQQGFQHHVTLNRCYHDNRVLRADTRLSVEDNGLGVPPASRHLLFKMFKRLHPNRSFGSGLGLYILRKSTEALGGTALYEARDKGSRFIIELPDGD